MARGGRRIGAGRPKGSRMSKTAALLGHIVENGVTPLEYILSVMRDEAQPAGLRFEAARAAAPYMHPRLASIDTRLETNNGISREEGRRLLREALSQMDQHSRAFPLLIENRPEAEFTV